MERRTARSSSTTRMRTSTEPIAGFHPCTAAACLTLTGHSPRSGVVQSAERRPLEPDVGGSSPPPGASFATCENDRRSAGRLSVVEYELNGDLRSMQKLLAHPHRTPFAGRGRHPSQMGDPCDPARIDMEHQPRLT